MSSRRPPPIVMRKRVSGMTADSPTSSAGVFVPTPGRAATGGSFQPALSPAAGKEQAERQQQLESLLSLPKRIVRVGGGYKHVPYGVEEVLEAAISTVTKTHGKQCLDEKAELVEALGEALSEADEARAALTEQPAIVDEMRARVEQAQRDAARHETTMAAFKLEADAAQGAASDAQRLQTDLLQVQRQLAAWVVEAVERGRAQRKKAAHLRDAASEARERGMHATETVQQTLGGQLLQTHSTLEGVARSHDALAAHNDKLLDSLAFFADARATMRATLRAMHAWRAAHARTSLTRTADDFRRASRTLRTLNLWRESEEEARAARARMTTPASRGRLTDGSTHAPPALEVDGETVGPSSGVVTPAPARVDEATSRSYQMHRELSLLKMRAPKALCGASSPAAAASPGHGPSSMFPLTPLSEAEAALAGASMAATMLEEAAASHADVPALNAGLRLAHTATAARPVETATSAAMCAAAIGHAAASAHLPEGSGVAALRACYAGGSSAAASRTPGSDGTSYEMPAYLRAAAQAASDIANALPLAGAAADAASSIAAEPSEASLQFAEDDEEGMEGHSTPPPIAPSCHPHANTHTPPPVAVAAVGSPRVPAAPMRKRWPDATDDSNDEVSSTPLAGVNLLPAFEIEARVAHSMLTVDDHAEVVHRSEAIAAAHVGPIAFEASQAVESALAAVSACASAIGRMELVEAAATSAEQQDTFESHQRAALAADDALAAVDELNASFQERRANDEEDTLATAAQGSLAAVEVVERAFAEGREDDQLDVVHSDEVGREALAAIAGMVASLDLLSSPPGVEPDCAAMAADGAARAVAAAVFEMVDTPAEAREAEQAIASAAAAVLEADQILEEHNAALNRVSPDDAADATAAAVATSTAAMDATCYGREALEMATYDAEAARLGEIARNIVSKHMQRDATLRHALTIAARREARDFEDLADAAIRVEDATASPYLMPDVTAVEMDDAIAAADAMVAHAKADAQDIAAEHATQYAHQEHVNAHVAVQRYAHDVRVQAGVDQFNQAAEDDAEVAYHEQMRAHAARTAKAAAARTAKAEAEAAASAPPLEPRAFTTACDEAHAHARVFTTLTDLELQSPHVASAAVHLLADAPATAASVAANLAEAELREALLAVEEPLRTDATEEHALIEAVSMETRVSEVLPPSLPSAHAEVRVPTAHASPPAETPQTRVAERVARARAVNAKLRTESPPASGPHLLLATAATAALEAPALPSAAASALVDEEEEDDEGLAVDVDVDEWTSAEADDAGDYGADAARARARALVDAATQGASAFAAAQQSRMAADAVVAQTAEAVVTISRVRAMAAAEEAHAVVREAEALAEVEAAAQPARRVLARLEETAAAVARPSAGDPSATTPATEAFEMRRRTRHVSADDVLTPVLRTIRFDGPRPDEAGTPPRQTPRAPPTSPAIPMQWRPAGAAAAASRGVPILVPPPPRVTTARRVPLAALILLVVAALALLAGGLSYASGFSFIGAPYIDMCDPMANPMIGPPSKGLWGQWMHHLAVSSCQKKRERLERAKQTLTAERADERQPKAKERERLERAKQIPPAIESMKRSGYVSRLLTDPDPLVATEKEHDYRSPDVRAKREEVLRTKREQKELRRHAGAR